MNALTIGDFKDEVSSAESFDKFSDDYSAYWSVHKEIPGVYLHTLPSSRPGSPRIDRILMPKQRLIDAGWTCGAIGVEIKRSGEKIGKVVSQCIDYRHAAFRLASGYEVFCRQVFIWPFSCVGGDIESVMAQYRIGGVNFDGFEGTFWLGQQRAIIFRGGSVYQVMTSHVESLGKKRGNRG